MSFEKNEDSIELSTKMRNLKNKCFNYRGINQIKKSTWLSNARETTKNHQIMLTALLKKGKVL